MAASGISLCFQLNMNLRGGFECDGQSNAFEAGNEVEGAFFWNVFKSLRGAGADGEDAVRLGDADGFGVGLGDGLGGFCDDGKDELQVRL